MNQPIPTLSAEHQAFLAETKARNSIYAGMTMEVEDETKTETKVEDETPVETETETVVKEEPKEELSPEELRELVTKANAEAANFRVKLRNAQKETADAVAKADSLEEAQAASAALVEKVAALEHQLLVSAVAQKHKLPDDLSSLLQGDDEEALNTHAAVLAKYIPKGAARSVADLGGGLNPAESDDSFDAVATARAARRRR